MTKTTVHENKYCASSSGMVNQRPNPVPTLSGSVRILCTAVLQSGWALDVIKGKTGCIYTLSARQRNKIKLKCLCLLMFT